MTECEMSGADFIADALRRDGIECLFSCPGGNMQDLAAAFRRHNINVIETVSEQGAVHAADGYARASGRLGVALVGSGAGAAGAITGLATAMLDSVPLLVLSGQVAVGELGGDVLGCVDIANMSMAITKHNFLIKNGAYLTQALPFALKLTRSGRPGPVLVDLPLDVQRATIQEREWSSATAPATIVADETDIAAAAALLAQAERPLIIAGGGAVAAQAQDLLRELAKQGEIPVATTLMGLGVMMADDPLNLGFTGMHGSRLANQAVCQADLLLVVGSRFSDRVTGDRLRYGEGKQVIHLDVDPAEVDKNIFAHVAVVGDINDSLRRLLDRLTLNGRDGWSQQLKRWRTEYGVVYDDSMLNAPWLMRRIAERTRDERCIFVTDVGQNQMWAAQHLAIDEPRQWLTSGGLGTMGFGLPAALGAQAAQPQRRVVHIAGDGGFRMTCAELHSLMSRQLPVISVVLDNSCLGMVRQWQQLFYHQRYSASLAPLAVDWVQLGAAFGVQAQVAATPEEFENAWAAAWAAKEPRLIVARIMRSDLVTPMIAPNSALDSYVELEK